MTRLLLTTDAVGGVWTYALDLADGLSSRGVDVVLAVLGPACGAGQRRAAEAVPRLKLVETGLALDWTAEDPAALRRAAQGLAALARGEAVDLIHLNSPALAAGAAYPAPVIGVAHSDLATWWSAVKEGAPPAEFGWRIDATAQGYAACDALMTPSAAFGHATAEAYGVRPTVVRNGRATPAAVAEVVRSIPIITSGRLWDEGKGMGVLDRVAALIDAPICALGPSVGPNGEQAVLPRLTLAGARSAAEVGGALALSQVFVSPALYEPFGLGVLEAAQAGCALVLSDIPTFRELWSGAALFAPPGDEAAFAAVLDALLADDAQRLRLAAAARRRARRYSAAAFIEGVAAVYADVLARPPRRVLQESAA